MLNIIGYACYSYIKSKNKKNLDFEIGVKKLYTSAVAHKYTSVITSSIYKYMDD